LDRANVDECLLDWVQTSASLQTLDRHDVPSCQRGNGLTAGAHRLTVNEHGARTA
jgi:hypothetical protein